MTSALKRVGMLVVVLVLCIGCITPAAYAVSGEPDIKGSESFEGLSGNGKYLSDSYRNNYALDTEELGFMDSLEKAGKYLANVLLDMDAMIAYIGLRVFHASMQLNIAELAGDQLDAIQQALKNSIFEPMFLVAFIGVAWALVRKLLYHNLTGIVAELAKVLLIIVFVAMLGTNTSNVLYNVCDISRSLGLSVVMQINGKAVDGDPEAFAAETAGVLWDDLVHQPWLHLEFQGDTSYTEGDVNAILGKAPYSDDRQEVIDQYIQVHPGTFSKESAVLRIGTLLIYSLVMLIKLFVYVACAIVMLAFQLLAIFYALLGVVVMILAMFEAFGGIYLIADWIKRMAETQIMILITTMLMGVLIWFGTIMRFLDGTLGWLAGMLLQTAIIVVVFALRKQLLHGIMRMTRSPGALPKRVLGTSMVGAASAVYHDQRMERDRRRTVQYQMGAMELQRAQLSYTDRQQDLVERQQETEDLRQEKLRQDLERREEARQRREAREAEVARKKELQTTEQKVSRPTTTAQNTAEPEYSPEPTVQRPVTTGESGPAEKPDAQKIEVQTTDTTAFRPTAMPKGVAEPTPEPTVQRPATSTEGGASMQLDTGAADTTAFQPATAPGDMMEPEQDQTQEAETPRPLTTASAPDEVRRSAAEQPERAAMKSADALPEMLHVGSKPAQSPSERREALPVETRRTPQTASYAPVRPVEERKSTESAVRRPVMPPEHSEGQEVPRDLTRPKEPAAAAQIPRSIAADEGAQHTGNDDSTTNYQMPKTHRDLAAAKAEQKQAQAGRAASVGVMHYDRTSEPEAPQGVERPGIEPPAEPPAPPEQREKQKNTIEEEKTT